MYLPLTVVMLRLTLVGSLSTECEAVCSVFAGFKMTRSVYFISAMRAEPTKVKATCYISILCYIKRHLSTDNPLIGWLI